MKTSERLRGLSAMSVKLNGWFWLDYATLAKEINALLALVAAQHEALTFYSRKNQSCVEWEGQILTDSGHLADKAITAYNEWNGESR